MGQVAPAAFTLLSSRKRRFACIVSMSPEARFGCGDGVGRAFPVDRPVIVECRCSFQELIQVREGFAGKFVHFVECDSADKTQVCSGSG